MNRENDREVNKFLLIFLKTLKTEKIIILFYFQVLVAYEPTSVDTRRPETTISNTRMTLLHPEIVGN